MMTACSKLEPLKNNTPENAGWNRDEFLAMLSHEIRNSTQNILSWVGLLCARPASQEILSQALEVIRRNAQLQDRLIKQLLESSRKNSGEFWLDSCRVALVPILEATINTMRPQAVGKGIELQAELEPSAAAVVGDAAQMEEVFTNLLSNAIKFTPVGGRIDVRLSCWQGTAQIAVSDTGRGISPEFLPHVFERFRQERGNSAGQDGLGLGLAIARHMVERHGGKIYAFSPGEGKGATFVVRFPLGANAVAGARTSETWTTSASDRV